jgi:hypothetical protein
VLRTANRDAARTQRETQRADQELEISLKANKRLQDSLSLKNNDRDAMKHIIVNRYGVKEFVNGREIERS